MSTVPRPNQNIRQAASVYQVPRTVKHSEIFWLNMDVNFAAPAVANELRTAYSDPEGFSVIVRGAWSNLATARVRFIEDGSRRECSVEQNPILGQAGNSDKTLPIYWWEQPVVLPAQALLRGDFINTGSETGGRVNFMGEIIGRDRDIRVSRSYWFRLLVDLGNASLIGRTTQLDSDVLIWGASTNAAVTILGRIIDNATNYAWMSEQIPVRAFAGLSTAVQPVIRYHRPYLLRALSQLRVEFSSAVTGNYIEFICERLIS